MGRLRMVGMRSVNGIGFPFADIHRKRLAVIGNLRIIRLSIMPNKILKKRVRASRIIRRIGHRQNIFILADGKPLDLPKLRILEFLPQLYQKIFPAFFVVFNGHAETFNRTQFFCSQFLVREKGHVFRFFVFNCHLNF